MVDVNAEREDVINANGRGEGVVVEDGITRIQCVRGLVGTLTAESLVAVVVSAPGFFV